MTENYVVLYSSVSWDLSRLWWQVDGGDPFIKIRFCWNTQNLQGSGTWETEVYRLNWSRNAFSEACLTLVLICRVGIGVTGTTVALYWVLNMEFLHGMEISGFSDTSWYWSNSTDTRKEKIFIMQPYSSSITKKGMYGSPPWKHFMSHTEVEYHWWFCIILMWLWGLPALILIIFFNILMTPKSSWCQTKSTQTNKTRTLTHLVQRCQTISFWVTIITMVTIKGQLFITFSAVI